jgi:hypothetical protein
MAAAAADGPGLDTEHTVAGQGRHIHEEAEPAPIARHRHTEVAAVGTVLGGNHVPVGTAVGWDSFDDDQRIGSDVLVTIPSEIENGMRHSLHSRSLHEPVVNSVKGELENWKYSLQPGCHHDPPWSSNLEF